MTLKRRVGAWREKQGLPVLLTEPTLPALDVTEEEHALHLARLALQAAPAAAHWRLPRRAYGDAADLIRRASKSGPQA